MSLETPTKTDHTHVLVAPTTAVTGTRVGVGEHADCTLATVLDAVEQVHRIGLTDVVVWDVSEPSEGAQP